jgi:hypothetical protein
VGERVGVPWLGHTCGVCPYCRAQRENLCDDPLFTGYTRDGGFATSVDRRRPLCLPARRDGDDVALAPLLCAGLIGWRSLPRRRGKRLGLYGFGAAGHIVAQVAKWQGARVFAFTGPGDEKTQAFAQSPGRPPGPADPTKRRPSRSTPRSSTPPSAISCLGAEGGPQGRPRRLRGHPHERHPELPLRPAVGGAAAGVGRQPHAPGRARLPQPGPQDRHRHENHDLPAREGQSRRWPIYAPDGSKAPRSSASADSIGEVIVTAQRRVENIQNVPITIQALTSETLKELNVSTIDDAIKYLPNVTASGSGPGQNELIIRGLATSETGNQGEGTTGSFPNVAVYLDDQSAQLPGRNLDIYAADLERIEVLEGPQGTLFGAGAQAGVIRYITNKPKIDVTEANVNAGFATTAHGDQSGNLDAMLNVPVIPDTLALRAVIYDDARGG